MAPPLAAAPAAVYVAGAGLVAGIAYLISPPEERMRESFADAVVGGG